jgi:hypothetical protein
MARLDLPDPRRDEDDFVSKPFSELTKDWPLRRRLRVKWLSFKLSHGFKA